MQYLVNRIIGPILSHLRHAMDLGGDGVRMPKLGSLVVTHQDSCKDFWCSASWQLESPVTQKCLASVPPEQNTNTPRT